MLSAERRDVTLRTDDGLVLVGELALPLNSAPIATLVCLYPLPTHGGSMDSHLVRKASYRLPHQAGLAVLRFNTRGSSSARGTTDGAFDAAEGATTSPRPWTSSSGKICPTCGCSAGPSVRTWS